MCRILGDLIQEGCVTKIADDLYCGGNSAEELLTNWEKVLSALHNNRLRLSARKTLICPRSATILGWIWSSGTLRVSPHRLSALSSVSPPTTVQSLRSFLGAYKVLSRVLHGYADLLRPLELLASGCASRDKISWTDDALQAFDFAKKALKDSKVITIPHPDDSLWIVTDGSVKMRGIAATLYTLRGEKLLLAGFFNAQLKKHQVTWLPCEIEALAIGMAVKHFSRYIIQSDHISHVLTDTRPCVQAYDKLCRGEFSASSHVTTFLSLISRYHATVRHISGAANLPSDFTSRNPITCQDQSCQICKFVAESEHAAVRSLTLEDITNGSARMPFVNRYVWITAQQECPDLRRVHAHLTQGTRPSKKVTNIPDVKRYLRILSLSNDGCLVVMQNHPLQKAIERIVVPRLVIDGLLTAIHLRFNHPSSHQLRQLVTRYFFALDLDRSVSSVTSSCHHCSSLKRFPTFLHSQTSVTPPDRIGTSFAVDVMRRYKEYVLVLRETISSYTLTSILPSESRESLREALLVLCAEVSSCDTILIRADGAPGFTSMVNDPILQKSSISLEIGRIKNKNKNPVAERAVEELGLEILHICPEGGPISRFNLALATANMNRRIRHSGLSSFEIWTQRDQITGDQLPINDRQIILSQQFGRVQNHSSSARAKAHGKAGAPTPQLRVGDLIYLYSDADKTKTRDKYMIPRC